MDTVKLVECPRDAWQGLPEIIPTETKVNYLRELVAAGFQHIDAVSFVSPKHVNEKGLERALATPGVSTIGYPYSISAYFRRANANMTRGESRALVETLKRDTKKANKDLVIYISMAFGNPYEEPWGPEIVQDTLDWLKDISITTVSLADTVGTATPEL